MQTCRVGFVLINFKKDFKVIHQEENYSWASRIRTTNSDAILDEFKKMFSIALDVLWIGTKITLNR